MYIRYEKNHKEYEAYTGVLMPSVENITDRKKLNFPVKSIHAEDGGSYVIKRFGMSVNENGIIRVLKNEVLEVRL